jgi:hypothetical protein
LKKLLNAEQKANQMACSVRDITNSVVSTDKAQTERNVRKVLKATDVELASATNSPLAFLTALIKKTKPTLDGETVHVLNLTRNPEGEFVMSYKVGKSNKVLEIEIEDFSSFMTSTNKFRLDKRNLTKFYSDFETLNSFDDYEVLALDITNNPQKIMDVADDLVQADKYHNDPEHNNVLYTQLGRIVDSLAEMVPNLNVHINNAGSANFGEINVKTNDIYISKGIGGSKSLMEIYVHELYHGVTHYAISSADIGIRNVTARMEKIRDNFLKNTKEVDLVRMSGGRLTTEQASKVLDHLSDKKVGLHEFVALSMTNKAIMNQLKVLDLNAKKGTENKTLFYQLIDAVSAVFNFIVAKVTKEPTDSDLSRMVFLVSRLQEAHKKPVKAKRLVALRNLISMFDPLEKRWETFWEKRERDAKEDFSSIAQKEGENKVTYMARLVARSFYDEKARDIIGNMVTTFPFLKPEDTIRTVLRDMMQGDPVQNIAQALGMQSQVIDQQREFTAVQTAEMILESFTRALEEEEETMLTEVVLDTDLSSIYFAYDMESLLSDNKNINKAINKILKKLQSLTDESSTNFYNAQAALLADYMMQGKDNIALLKNAENIAMKLGTSMETRGVSSEVIGLVDELVTLKALRQVSKDKKSKFKDLIEEQQVGVDNLVAFQFGQKDYAEKTLFPTPADRINIIKGYSAEITNEDIEITTAPLAKRKELESQGYILKSTLTKHSFDGSSSELGLFINNRFMMQTFHRVGLRITDKARRGTSVTDIYAMNGDSNVTLKAAADIRKMRTRKDEVTSLMAEGKYKPEENENDSLVSPILNNTGAVKDFSYGMDKKVKIDVLDMERKVSVVMGRTAASTYDKKETEVFNEKILKLIEEDAAANLSKKGLIGKRNNKEYIQIKRNSTNKEVIDFWKILPSDIKRRYPEGFALRRDLMYSYLGFREIGIADLPGVRNFVELYPKTYGKLIKYALQFAEKLWQEVIKISKIDIIIRTPGVFIGNIVSNFLLMYISGYSFKEITQLKLQGVKELNSYVTGLKESIKLMAKQKSGIITKAETRRLNVIKNNLTNSPVKDLVDQGFYTSIIEETEHGDNTGSYFNRMAKKKLKQAPKVFSDGIDILYITENTKLFKLMEKGIQASDFAARYAQYHLLVKDGKKKEDAVRIVRDNFIDYNKPNSRFLEYANQMGFVMFTKYFTRIQRVLFRYGKTDPIKVLLSILAQDYVFGEIDTVDDQSIFVKDMGNLFYNPWDNLLRAITPSSIEAVDWALNGS